MEETAAFAKSDEVDYGETGEIRSDFIGIIDTFTGDYHPETLSIDTFRKMIYEDSQVSAAFNFLVMSTLAKGWEFNYDGKDEDLKEEMTTLIKRSFEKINRNQGIRGGINLAIREMMTSIWAGFSVTEVVWGYDEQLKAQLPTKLKTLPPETIKFNSDKKLGNLKEVWQFPYDVYTSGLFRTTEHVSLPLDRLLIWSYRKDFGNKYGRSDLKQCYKYWYIKDFVLKFWSIFIERYGKPLIWGKTRASRMKAMRDQLKHIHTKTDFVVELEDALDILETKHEGEQFKELIAYCDKMIMTGFLVPSMVINPPEKGARALGDTMMKAFGWRIGDIQKDIEFMINTLIMWIINFNYPENKIEAYPKFKFRPLTQYDTMKMAQAIQLLVNAKVIHPLEKWIRDYLTMPDPDPEFFDLLMEMINNPKEEKPPGAGKPENSMPNNPPEAKPPQEPPEKEPTHTDEGSKQDEPITDRPVDEFSKRPDDGADLAYKDIVSFDSMEVYLDMKESQLFVILAEFLQTVPDLVFKEMESAGLVAEEKALDVEPPPFDYTMAFKMNMIDVKSLQTTLDTYFHNLTSEVVAAEASSLVEMGMSASFDVDSRLGALNWIEQNMSQRMDLILARGGSIATDMQFQIWRKTRDVVMQGLQEGMDIGRIQKELTAQFGQMYSKNRIQTIARTNSNYAYNAGKIGFYKANSDFVKSVEYSAVLDKRTTFFCEDMHGSILAINDPLVEKYTPPNHFNCRSTWIPVTTLDTEVEPDFDEDQLETKPQEGFASLTGAL